MEVLGKERNGILEGKGLDLGEGKGRNWILEGKGLDLGEGKGSWIQPIPYMARFHHISVT